MRSFLILLLIALYFSCSGKYNLSEKRRIALAETVKQMYELDQGHRKNFYTIDSMFGVDKKSAGRFLFTSEKKEILNDRYSEYKKKQDSLWKVIHKIDSINTNELIKITKKYGFPSQERLKTHRAEAYFLFVHSDRIYHDEIRELINKEFEENRISEYEKAYIMWHLDGRKGMPPMLGKDGKVIYN